MAEISVGVGQNSSIKDRAMKPSSSRILTYFRQCIGGGIKA
jgi:hypothetical protein